MLCGSRLQPRQKGAQLSGALAPEGEGVDVGRIARRVRQAGVYFVTTDTWQKHPLFINTDLANIVIEQILGCRDRGFYKLHAFVLMPDHLHILLTPGDTSTVEKAMQMIKGGSAHKMGLERPQKFPVWHAGFHDRWMRDAEEYWGSKQYIEQNPIKAKLVERPEDYPFASASGNYVLDLSRFDEARG
jgi:putative transposase